HLETSSALDGVFEAGSEEGAGVVDGGVVSCANAAPEAAMANIAAAANADRTAFIERTPLLRFNGRAYL
ncbi:MAG: hypothetical protein ACHQ50_18110, partial [Fimbriimonadales bacterium]